MRAGRVKMHYKTTGTRASTTTKKLGDCWEQGILWVFSFYRVLKTKPHNNKFLKIEPFEKLTFSLNSHSANIYSFF
jgi:hypothetical protein